MAPLIKDTLDVATSSSEPVQPVVEKPTPSHFRADAVSLEVHVKVHGSKVTEIGRGLPPHTEPFEEQTSTMIVFSQGAVLRLVAPVAAGQMLVVTNSKSGKDAICRVAKVRANASLPSYVEIEFTAHQSGYWGVNFPGEYSASSRPASTFQSVSAAPPITPLSPQPMRPAAISTPSSQFAQSSAPVSAFATIGSQEKVQPAASAIPRPVLATPSLSFAPLAAGSPAEPVLDEAKLTAAIGAASQQDPHNDSMSLSLEELIGDSISSAESESTAAASARPDTAENAVASFAEREKKSTASVSAPVESSTSESPENFATSSESASGSSFGEGLDATLTPVSALPPASGRNWLVFAACVGFAFVASAGGFLLFHSHAFRHPARTVAASSPNPLPSTPADSSVLGVPISKASVGPVAPFNSRLAAIPNSSSVAAVPPPSSSVSSTAGLPVPKPAVTNEMVSDTLNAHPLASQHTQEEVAVAPAIDASSGESNAATALPGAISAPSHISVPTPRLLPEGPVKIGGEVKEPRLISSLPPMYPHTALQFNVQGDVVIQATVDKKGVITDARVISGPALLRQAALDALRHWKYAPSTLDGQPIAAQITVTIHFHHQ